MRNVQRTASCGDGTAYDEACAKERCRSNEIKSGAIALSITTQGAFNSDAEPFFASGSETGPVVFCEVAQQVLLAQQAG